MTIPTIAQPVGLSRWWTYQRERFPVLGHGPLILAFSSGAVCFSALLRNGAPQWKPLVVAFISSLLFFFQLRVDDEHKDFEDDARWRPYRPVPRGLVTLRELSTLAWASRLIQAALAFWLAPPLVGLLLLTWTYMALMRREFWSHAYLRTHPFTTLWTHMLVMPFIDLYATACDWMPNGGAPPAAGRVGLAWFLVASFFNGMVVEVGRKLRAPSDEEEGVDTYTRVWGPSRAVRLWFVVLAITFVSATAAGAAVHAVPFVAGALGLLAILAIAWGARLVRAPIGGAGKRLEVVAGLWTIALYATVGIVPWLARARL